MLRTFAKTVILFTLITWVSACGSATTDVSPTVTNVPPSPTTAPPPATPTDVPPTNAPSTAALADTPLPLTAPSPTHTTEPDTTDSPGLTSLTGAYLGQNPPGASPVRFAPDILLANSVWHWISPPKFSPDGREMVFTKYVNGNPDWKYLYAMHRTANDQWTLPQEVPFGAESSKDEDCHATFSIDGSKLFFLSDRSGKRFFFVTKDGDRWSDPVPVDIPNLFGGVGNQLSITRDGTIYFDMSESVTYDVPYDLYRSRLVNGEYGESENLGAAFNTDDYYEYAPFVDPDEDYVIFVSDRPGGFGGHDLYISFQTPDGSWTEPRNMGDTINSSAGDTIPYVSPDGKFFFFISRRAGDRGWSPYWVDAQVIEDLRPPAPLDSQDGEVLAYCYQPVAGASVKKEIHAINTDGSGDVSVIDTDISLNHHAWSPDAQRLAAVGYASETTWSIYVFDADGGNLVRLTSTSDVWDNDPAWSPAGTQIAFTRIYPDQNNREEIWLVNSDGSNQHWIGIEGGSAEWSPDGTRLIYHSQKSPDDSYDIYTCNTDGTDEKQLTSTPTGDIVPTYSPDGSLIAFTVVDDDLRHAIYIMNSDGTNSRRLTEGGAPKWSPDGSLLAFHSGPFEEWEVYVINSDGTDLRQVTNSPAGITAINPVWRPTTQTSVPPTPAAPTESAGSIPEFMQATMETLDSQDGFSGAVLVARDGEPLFKGAYGLANRELDIPNQVDTRFNLGSMDKMFTAVAILQLVEQGALSLDAKIADILPEYPNKQVAQTVTIHQLLTHTSGLGDWSESARFPDLHDQIRGVADYLPLFADTPLEFDPGDRFRYSNSGYIVLGLIIEEITGQSYYDYVRTNIFEPSGMNDTAGYELDAGVPDLAVGYTWVAIDGSELDELTDYHFAMPMRGGPSGGGFSTVEDLLRFQNALLDHRLLSPESTELLLAGKVRFNDQAQYAYGFMDRIVEDQRVLGHGGGAPGVCGLLNIYIEQGYTLVVLSNSDSDCLAPLEAFQEALLP